MTLPPFARSLSAKLLLLTILFVMLAEVLIFVPSVARYRLTFLQERLAAGHLAALSIEAAPEGMVTDALSAKLLDHVDAYVVDLILPDARIYMLSRQAPPVEARLDLRTAGVPELIGDALAALVRRENRVIHVTGPSPQDPAATVEVVMDEAPMVRALRDFGGRILALSIIISLMTAGLVFVSLNLLLVRPMRQITESMVAFRRDPENDQAVIVPGNRRDEIGIAQRELAKMQAALRTHLRQKERLAALGTAVTKINHDLRGILSTASLLSERLAKSDDPEVRRVTPRLMDALDRAVDLCTQTLAYTRDGVLPLRRSSFPLADLVDQVGAELTASHREPPRWVNQVAEGTAVLADREQLHRALANLARNACQAGAGTVTVRALVDSGRLTILVADDGPGLPPRARDNLFQPFAGSARVGGTGLGLAIAKEILRAHGGDLRLVETSGSGTTFALDLPAGGMSR